MKGNIQDKLLLLLLYLLIGLMAGCLAYLTI